MAPGCGWGWGVDTDPTITIWTALDPATVANGLYANNPW